MEKATIALNISFNKAIDTSPYVAKFGINFNMEPEAENPIFLESKMKEIHSKIRAHNEKYQKAIEKGRIYKKRNIEIGKAVLIYNQMPRKSLEASWIPGYKVIRWVGDDSYKASDGIKRVRLNKIHVKLNQT